MAFTGKRRRHRSLPFGRSSCVLGPDGYSAIVQEVHIAMGHIICDLVEQELLFRVSA